jgi:hypothetical protein
MSEYRLTTTWSIPAPVESVWKSLIDTGSWPDWWQYVISVEPIASGDASGLNTVKRYQWRTCLPYHLALTICVTELQILRFVEVAVSGDLQGTGSCQLSFHPEVKRTQVVFQWNVSTCKFWMNWLPVLSRPIFIWNHAQVMQGGEIGLIRYLSEPSSFADESNNAEI